MMKFKILPTDRNKLLQFHEEVCNKAREIMAAKNHDYAGASGQTPYANFEVIEQIGVASTEQGFLVRMMDKFKRLSTFVNVGVLKVTGEGFEDACLDILNYIILFLGYCLVKRTKEQTERFAPTCSDYTTLVADDPELVAELSPQRQALQRQEVELIQSDRADGGTPHFGAGSSERIEHD